MKQNKGLSKELLALAVETSGRAGSVAIGVEGELSEEKSFSGNMRHSVELFDTIIALLKNAGKSPQQIDHIYISAGPGSFTGIRIAVTLAKTMALANNTRIVAVNSMDALAENADFADINRIATILDAKRGEFFTAVFEKQNNRWQKTGSDSVISAPEFVQKYDNEPTWLLGEGLLYYADRFETENIKILDQKYWHSRAANIYKLGSQSAKQNKFDNPATLLPYYMRRTEAEENWEKKNKK